MLCAPDTSPEASSRAADVASSPRSTSTAAAPGSTS